MRKLLPLWHLACHTYFTVALNQLSARAPCHPDVSFLVLKIRHHRDGFA